MGEPQRPRRARARQRIEESAFIGVHRRPICMCRFRPIPLRTIFSRRSTPMNADFGRNRRIRLVQLIRGHYTKLNMATLLFAPQPLAYARGSVRRRFGAANVRERMRNYL